jgi:Lar family restriction alleviation protein
MTELKPCPFCGSKAEVWEGVFGGWRAFCTNRKSCGAMIVCATEQDAIIEWNKRIPPTTKQIEEYIEKTHKENKELIAKLQRKYEVES